MVCKRQFCRKVTVFSFSASIASSSAQGSPLRNYYSTPLDHRFVGSPLGLSCWIATTTLLHWIITATRHQRQLQDLRERVGAETGRSMELVREELRTANEMATTERQKGGNWSGC